MPDFRNPAAFFLLLLVPALFIARALGVFTRIAFPATLSDWGGKTFEWKGRLRSAASFVSRIFIIAAFAFTVAALADPVVYHQERVYTSRGADILFVVDTSPSMAVKDIANMTRLDAARRAIRTLSLDTGGISFGLVAMATEAAIVVPPTTDRAVFFSRLDALSIGSLGDGTAIGTGLSTAVYHLSSSAAPKKCIVLVTDGENNAGSIHPETAARTHRFSFRRKILRRADDRRFGKRACVDRKGNERRADLSLAHRKRPLLRQVDRRGGNFIRACVVYTQGLSAGADLIW